MSVTFDEEQQITRVPQTGVSGLYALVIRWGFAKNEKQAVTVLLVVAAACVVLAGFALFSGKGSTTVPPDEYAERARSQDTAPR
jgi:hypothetical protein